MSSRGLSKKEIEELRKKEEEEAAAHVSREINFWTSFRKIWSRYTYNAEEYLSGLT